MMPSFNVISRKSTPETEIVLSRKNLNSASILDYSRYTVHGRSLLSGLDWATG